jgi:hypothetical protein
MKKNETEPFQSVLAICLLREKGLFMRRHYWKRPAFVALVLFCTLSINHCLFADPGERFTGRQMHNDGGSDHKGGAAGGLAALLLGAANFPVLLSLLLKSLTRFMPESVSLKARIRQLNALQKKYLMKLHYWVNPLALGVAIAHFWSSACRSTAIPELGMGAMLIVSVLGLMITLRLSTPAIRSIVCRLHTNPIITVLVFSALIIGHSVIH